MRVSFGRTICVLIVLAAACSGNSPLPAGGTRVVTPGPDGTPEASNPGRACGLSGELLLRTWRGFHPQRSGDLQLVPREPNHIGSWFPHSGPWDYLQRVPMLWYGPGLVPGRGQVTRPVTMADVAPTIAGLVGFRFRARDGHPMVEAIPPGEFTPPRLVATVVWDGGGRNVLAEYPDAWPNLRRMIERGVWFGRATVGSSPSATPPVHATLGTGAFPRHHGLIDLRFEVDGRFVPAMEEGPQYLAVRTLADRYDLARQNRPEIGLVAFREWHLAMIGHGTSLPGADADLAVHLDRASGRWALDGPNAAFFEFASYANRVPGRQRFLQEQDLEDGKQDGMWLGEQILDDPTLHSKTPAYTRWQTRLLEEIIRVEGFGADDIPDLLFTNYKQIDEVGHRWSMNSPQMEAVLRASDDALGELERVLDRNVGRGRWVLVLTADHGSTPKPELSGARIIGKPDVLRPIAARFDDDDDANGVIRQMRPTQVWLETRELRANGGSPEQVAAFVEGFRVEGKRFFDAVLPGRLLRGRACLGGNSQGAG